MESKGKIGGKIGVFDSGFGGLSILKEIVEKLSQYDYVYLGDSARAPYGNRSQEEICKFTNEGVDFLFDRGALMVILACNSASSEALRRIQAEHPKVKEGKKVLGVIFPAAEEAALRTVCKKIAVIGTEATISSHAFKREIQKIDGSIEVFEIATPLLAPIVEAGEDKSDSTKDLIGNYMQNVLDTGADTLILGCTHYGILEEEIMKQAKGIHLVSEGRVVANKLDNYLLRHTEIENGLSKNGNREFFTTDADGKFDTLGSRFFGKEINSTTITL
ncbi:MAG: glutamate racemase [Patescibacteria group bacterium]